MHIGVDSSSDPSSPAAVARLEETYFTHGFLALKFVFRSPKLMTLPKIPQSRCRSNEVATTFGDVSIVANA